MRIEEPEVSGIQEIIGIVAVTGGYAEMIGIIADRLTPVARGMD